MIRAAVLFCALLVLGQPATARDLLVFAAASLKEPLDRIAADFGGVTVSYGGSGALARQITFGAPADIVLLAHADWMDVLRDGGHVQAPSVRAFASNALVLVGPMQSGPVTLDTQGVAETLAGGRLAMGLTASVPAGIYGKQALTSLGMWDDLAGSVVEVDNVRAALALVARGEAPLGVVYQSDVRVAPQLAVLATFPAQTHDPIAYYGAAAAASSHPRALLFLDQLTSDQGQAAFLAAGFCAAGEGC